MSDPVTAALTRAPYLCPDDARAAATAAAPDAAVAAAAEAAVAGMLRCDATAPSPLAFVSKMFAVPPGALPAEPSGDADGAPKGERFLAFARVFGGTLRAGDAVHVLPPGAAPSCPPPDAPRARISAIYLMMGRALQPVSAAPAGAVVALAGLDTAVLKCATLAVAPCCAPLRGMYLQAAPTVRVALEPRTAAELPALLAGLSLLNRADPSVEVRVAPSGEVTLGVAGEVHLQRCLTDLRERFARVDVAASPPLVAFRESAAAEAWPAALAALLPRDERAARRERDRERERDKWAAAKEVRTPNGWCTLRARVAPLPAVAARALDEAADTLRAALASDDASMTSSSSSLAASAAKAALPPAAVRAALEARLAEAEAAAAEGSLGEPVEGAAAAAASALRRAWALGPYRCGANVLLVGERRGAGVPPSDDADAPAPPLGIAAAGAALGFADSASTHADASAGDAAAAALWADVAAGVAAGFQAACERGPLCDEPLWGVAVDICAELAPEALGGGGDGAAAGAEPAGGPACAAPFAGQVMDAARKAVRAALEAAAPRLVEQLFLCVVSTAPEALGGMYGVLSRRRARVLTERMLEGSGAFRVAALLPVAASFGLADDLRARTSGAAGAQLLLSHWERVAQDPRFVPTTADELEEFGADAAGAGPNAARALVDAVRRRKGLPVEEKVVAVATKQRTQARKR
jgi:ribosome assembly protein 1